jgi:uncharacterized protein (UPF0276 family)
MPEWAFLDTLCQEADCLLLLDLNNIHVSAVNHGFDALDFLDGVPLDRLQQVHLAGHTVRDGYRIDTHDAAVSDPVWALYREFVTRTGGRATMIERDDHIPALDDLEAELRIARRIAAEAPGALAA